MLLLDRQTTAAPRRGGAGPVYMRLHADGQLVELPLGKTTIGSSPRCNLRLERPGIEPLHCLVIHGPEGLSVRRWAADAQLNGIPFDDAPFAAGDRLTLGGVELELVDSQSPAEKPTAILEPEWTSEPESESEPVTEVAPVAIDAAEIVFNALQAACAISRGRSRKLLTALRSERNQKDELQNRLADAERQPAGGQVAEVSHEREWRDWEAHVVSLQQQIGELENRFADHSRQMTELQHELSTARSVPSSIVAPAPVVAWAPQPTIESQLERSTFEPESPAIKWPAKDDQPTNEFEAAGSDTDPWESPATASTGWDNAVAGAVEGVEPIVRANTWEESPSRSAPFDAEDDAFGTSAGSAEAFAEQPVWGSAEAATFGEPEAAVDEPPTAPVIEPNVWSTPEAAPTNEVAEPALPKVQPTSFIERYSHLFAEEGANEPTPVAVPPRPLAAEVIASKPRSMGVVRSEGKSNAAASGGDEESVEQYMAKLLQRVRGEGPHVPASQAMPAAAAKPVVEPPSATAAEAEVAQSSAEGPEAEVDPVEQEKTWDEFARRVATPVRATNLGALRALANESARSAISHHELKKHRRDAVTKVIVSTLAGMTSLWLMLLAPSWMDIQFITACVSLIVAAYWAGETFRAMLESFRAAAYDGPKGDFDSESAHGAALPIDVEN